MDAREQRGLMIAAKCRIRRKGNLWTVPSQTEGQGRQPYTVDPVAGTCSCPDCVEGGNRCKHQYAVQFVLEREYTDDGVVITETESLTLKTVRKTYSQSWPEYNRSQSVEKEQFQVLLSDLCAGIRDQRPSGRGRPRIPLRDSIFAATFKIFSTVSGRRFMCDMHDAHAKGFVSRVVHYNSIFDILEAPETGAVLQSLIVESAGPLKAVETNFAVDSTGLSGGRFDRWFDEKWGEQRSMRKWVKLHAMVGTATGIITAVEVLGKESADSPQLQPLMNTTAERFNIGQLAADAAYLSEGNLQAIEDRGAKALIPFKINSVATRPGVWNKAFHFFHMNRDEFLATYHRRSRIESTFSALKRKFGDGLRSKTDTAMRNEALGKCLCFNISVLVNAMHTLGVDPTFRAESPLARQITAG